MSKKKWKYYISFYVSNKTRMNNTRKALYLTAFFNRYIFKGIANTSVQLCADELKKLLIDIDETILKEEYRANFPHV